jgi:DnaK suppressor protein
MASTKRVLLEHLVREERELRQQVQNIRRKRQRQDPELFLDVSDSRSLDLFDAASLASQEQHNEAVWRRLADKTRALAEVQERVREGTYGLCRSCGSRIPQSRLQAVPTATLCVACQERRESVRNGGRSTARFG